jgi:hypothetical protein
MAGFDLAKKEFIWLEIEGKGLHLMTVLHYLFCGILFNGETEVEYPEES